MTITSLEDFNEYINFISTVENEKFTFALLDFKSESQIRGYGVRHGDIKKIKSALAVHPEATLHITLNATDLTGRKRENITNCRVLCVDLDRKVDISELKDIINNFGPHIIVETSPQKYHLYWKIDPIIPLDHWSHYQQGLAQYFKGDRNLSQTSKTIRVPGVLRGTKSGEDYTPTIIWRSYESVDTCPMLEERDIVGLFPWIDEQAEIAIEEMRKERKALARALKARQGAPLKLPGSMGRNDALYMAVRTFIGKLEFNDEGEAYEARGIEEAEEYGLEINSEFYEPLSREEALKTCRSAYQAGLKRYEYLFERWQEERESHESLLKDESGVDIVSGINEEAGGREIGKGKEKSKGKGAENGRESLGGTSIILSSENFKYDFESEESLRRNRFTDYGLLARVLQRFGKFIVRNGEQLYAFNRADKVWRVQDRYSAPELVDFVQACVLDTIDDPLFETALHLRNPDGSRCQKKLIKAQERFMNLTLQSKTVAGILNSPSIRHVTAGEFDAKNDCLFVKNGVLDLGTGEIREARAEDYMLARASGVKYVEGAKCPGWEEFLKEVFSESENTVAMVSFIQEMFGYSISGSIHEQKLFCHFGEGSNGKSKVLSALHKLLGDYATYVEHEDLVRAKGFGRAIERFGAKIEGKRVAIIDDVDVKAVWNEGIVKNLTSPELRARAEYQRSRTMVNRCKMHLGLNVAPAPEAENFGILRRICIIPYDRRFEPDPVMSQRIDEMIEEELPGILNWAIEGYRRMKRGRRNISYPEEVSLAIEEYKEEHFKVESVVKALYGSPVSQEEKGGADFVPISEIVTEVNKALSHLGSDERVTSQISKMIRRLFHTEPQRVWDNRSKSHIRGLYLVRKKRFSEPSELL